MEKSYKRNYSLDALRLLCMMMIVSVHYFGIGGGIRQAENVTTLNYLLASVGSVFCRPAVNCFYMISGYFLTPSEVITFKSLMKRLKGVWWRAFLCSVIVYISLVTLKIAPFDKGELLKSFFPIIEHRYWFITVFALVCLIRPFWGKALVNLKDKEILLLVLVLLFFDSVQSIVGVNGFAERGYGFLHALTMLTLGYSVTRINHAKYKCRIYGLIYVISCMLAGIAAVIEGKIFPDEVEASALLYNSPIIIIASLCLFCFFLRAEIKSTFFGRIAPHVLTIYLINDHPSMRKYFWQKILHCDVVAESKLMVFHFLLTVIGFVVAGILIDSAGCYVAMKIGCRTKRLSKRDSNGEQEDIHHNGNL